jgi:hypothetical protein
MDGEKKRPQKEIPTAADKPVGQELTSTTVVAMERSSVNCFPMFLGFSLYLAR